MRAPEPISSETLPAKSSTVLPDTSCTVTIGWVLNWVRFTKPAACVVIASLVAAPKVMVMLFVSVMLDGEVMVAVMS
jgi:hypothetical protein